MSIFLAFFILFFLSFLVLILVFVFLILVSATVGLASFSSVVSLSRLSLYLSLYRSSSSSSSSSASSSACWRVAGLLSNTLPSHPQCVATVLCFLQRCLSVHCLEWISTFGRGSREDGGGREGGGSDARRGNAGERDERRHCPHQTHRHKATTHSKESRLNYISRFAASSCGMRGEGTGV